MTIAGQFPRRSTLDARRLRFDRNELSGAFGDLGTDLPLIVGMILAARLDPASVLIVYGLLQVATGLVYRMPMPVQPLKAVAALVITQRLPAATLYGGGLAIGLTMLLLSVTGLLGRLARLVPKVVVRGIQAGLGLQLAGLALRDYVPSAGPAGWALAAAAFAVTLALLGNRRLPPAPFVVLLGVLFALATSADAWRLWDGFGVALPTLRAPTWADVTTGFVLLALPQIPLSLGNSVLATRQMATDLFPERPPLSVRRIGLTYSAMNLVSPFLGGVPTCHGSGGMAGHYAFGARTGGSVVLYGLFWLGLGLFFSAGFATVVAIFPKPVLGVLLLVEALALLVLLRDLVGDGGSRLSALGSRPPQAVAESREPGAESGQLWLALLVALIASMVPYGYLVGMVVGTALAAVRKQ